MNLGTHSLENKIFNTHFIKNNPQKTPIFCRDKSLVYRVNHYSEIKQKSTHFALLALEEKKEILCCLKMQNVLQALASVKWILIEPKQIRRRHTDGVFYYEKI